MISIIVTCYNQALYIEDCLKSINNQTLESWECIIIDDGSTDSSFKVIKNFIQDDKRFTLIRQQNSGVSIARNTGVGKTAWKYIITIDGDDKIAPFYLEEAINILEKNSKIKIVYSEAEYFGLKCGRWNLEEYSYKKLLLKNMIFNAAIFRREDFLRVGGFDENLTNGVEDWEFWISILKLNGKVFKLNSIGFYYRILESSRTSTFLLEDPEFSYQYIFKKHLDTYVKYYGSYPKFHNEIIVEKIRLLEQLSSIKHAVNIITNKFLGVSFFLKQKNQFKKWMK
ncbi:glycosyltransferase family 2 protein [Nonlabens sp.]|uniref:glycosyltransferase family 2 protein n=1 Tax=Nonlabens sp. TaxID=1888209 RepID=UPI003F695B75